MDTRGRPGDRRIDRPSQPPARQPAPADARTATVEDVEVVELSSVERRRRGIGTTIVVGVFAAAATLIVGLGLMPPLPPASSPAPSQAAVASQEAVSPAGATGSPSTQQPTPLATSPSTPRPTRVPTPAPTWNPGAWDHRSLDLGSFATPAAFWEVDDQLVILARDDEDQGPLRLLASNDAASWSVNVVPRAIADLEAGVVRGERLWFAARVESVTDAWTELVSTTDGTAWEPHGRIEAEGIDVKGVSAMAWVGGRWVVVAWEYVPDVDGGVRGERILASAPGGGWREVDIDVPDGAAMGSRLGIVDDRVVLLGGVWTQEGIRSYAATSHDGLDWTVREDVIPANVTEINDLRCRTTGCVGIASDRQGTLYRNLVLETWDGLEWRWSTPGELGMPSQAELVGLTETPTGYLLTISRSFDVWVFDDGVPAHAVGRVIDSPDLQPLYLARRGDEVFGVTQGPDGDLGVWRGLLSRLAG